MKTPLLLTTFALLLCIAFSTDSNAITKKEQARLDSIAIADSIARADSIAKEIRDSIGMAEAKAKSDSIIAADMAQADKGFMGEILGSDLYDMYERGGVFMPPLITISVIGFAIILWKFLVFLYLGIISFKLVSRFIFSAIFLFFGLLTFKLNVFLMIPLAAYILFSIYIVWSRKSVATQEIAITAAKIAKTDGTVKAIEFIQTKTGPIAGMIEAGLRRWKRGPEAVEKSLTTAGTLEVAFLEKGLVWLSTIAVVAPLLGFLGTVSGMINSFQAIAAAAQVNAKLVATGIFEALITTAAGLIIAIPIHAFHNYFVTTIDSYVVKMEETAEDLVDTMVE